ncbi:MarR family winged helix-turn-helix transcriptional regulator [Noviherbaspirillum sp.]|mgnify:CR=1 FL=1|uniref:MarR family winged helix-turn-helix transcriptional regulator n=1 Tax=Noviherbaspirillum sp. TaxID=1926288 RepID=UPI002FE2B28E
MPADKPSQPQGCTNFKIRQMMRLVSQQYDAELGKTGLKTTQYSLLAHVERLGPIRPGELAQAMRLDASTLTRNLKPLVDAGWLRIEAGTDDRSRSVIITDAGRAKREEAKRYWKAAQDKINRILGVERVLALHALIDDSLALLSTNDQGAEHE